MNLEKDPEFQFLMLSPADTLTLALWDSEQRTQLRHAQIPDPQDL